MKLRYRIRSVSMLLKARTIADCGCAVVDLVKDNLAVRDLGVIAYAGVPVLNSEGAVLGSFCVIDTKPRQWTTDDVELLFSLSAQVSSYVQLQGQSKKLSADLMSQKAVEADRRQMLRLNVHDLRTPLSAMMLAMDVVKLLGPLNDEQKNTSRCASETARRF